MSSNDEYKVEEFESVDSGASNTYPVQAGNLKKGDYVVLNNRPCKIAEISWSKTGKHGHAKVHIVGIDIFTERKYDEVHPSDHTMDAPIVTRREYPLISIADDGFITLLLPNGTTKEDLALPEGELSDKIRSAYEEGKDLLISILSALGEEGIVAFKEQPSK